MAIYSGQKEWATGRSADFSRCEFSPLLATGHRPRPHRLRKVRQFVEYRRTAQPKFVVNGGIATDDGTSRYVARNSTLRGGNGAITDFAVTGNAELSGKPHVIADLG